MKETRAVTNGRGATGRVAEVGPDLLKLAIDCGSFFDVIEKRDVVAGFDRRELRLSGVANRRWRIRLWQPTVLRELAEQFPGRILRFLHVWLVERVDAESPT